MAEILNSKNGQKHSTKVDLTPMVDLGFLLITFFIFATTLAMPKAVKFKVPNDDDPIMRIKILEEAALTALVSNEPNTVYYYQGEYKNDGTMSRISVQDFRQVIIAQKQKLQGLNIPDSLLSLSIKALPKATYGDFISVFDEVAINRVGNYFKVRPEATEIAAINDYNIAHNLALVPKED